MPFPFNIKPTFSKDTFYLIVVGILVVIILFLRSCSPSPDCPGGGKPDTVTVVDTAYLEVIKEVPVYIPGPITYIPQDVPVDVDTAAILKDYFAKVVYKDTIRLDSLGFIYVKDTISQNRIKSRKLTFDYIIPIITTTTTITIPPKSTIQVYVGGEMMIGAPTGLTYIGPNFTLKTKKDQMYSLGAGLSPSGGIQYKIGTSWKIKFK